MAVIEVSVMLCSENARIPSRAFEDDAGLDLYASEKVLLKRGGGRAVVRTGVCLALPPGIAGLVVPRSGLAAKHGVTCLNAPGLIDPGYRGQVKVVLINLDPDSDYLVKPGDRIAQLLTVRFEEVVFKLVDSLPSSARGDGGFGHSGR